MEDSKRKCEIDPDYKDLPEPSFKRIRLDNDEEDIKNYERMVQVFQREFQKEICNKREEVHKIQQQLLKAQKTLHLLKYIVVKSFYESKDLKITNTNEIPVLQSSNANTNINESTNNQSRIHPAIKKLIGKRPLNYEPYRTRNKGSTRSKKIIRSGENVTIKEEPDEEVEDIKNDLFDIQKPVSEINKQSMETEMIPVRNRDKVKYRIIVGNISKWMPSNSSTVNSTHKWMVYVRGPKENPDISNIVKKVRFFLHPSYQPNDIVDVQESPYHLSRRGWGEFPLRVQIHFKNSKNKPIDIIHNIKLDRTYTGRQTMGEETLVDAWVYEENLEEFETVKNIRENPINYIKQELNFDYESLVNKPEKIEEKESCDNDSLEKNVIKKCIIDNCDRLANFIESCTEDLKEIEQLERANNSLYEETEDDNAITSLQQPQEFTFNDNETSNLKDPCDSYDSQMSLLFNIGVKEIDIPQTDSLFNIETEAEQVESDNNIRDVEKIYLEDHCYTNRIESQQENDIQLIKIPKYVVGKSNWTSNDHSSVVEKEKHKIKIHLEYFRSISQIVFYMFKNLPLVTELANDNGYICMYPYTATSLDQFLSWTTTKQFCSEWYRAKHIQTFLKDHNLDGHKDWTIKSILMFGQAHGFSITERSELFHKRSIESGKTVPNRCESPIDTNTYTEAVSFKELLDFKSTIKSTSNDENDIDVLEIKEYKKCINSVHEKDDKVILTGKDLLLPCTFINQTVEKLGLNLELEEIDEDVYQKTSERIILKSVMCLAEELIRKALANNIVDKKIRKNEKEISKNDIFNVLLEREEFSVFLNVGLGKNNIV